MAFISILIFAVALFVAFGSIGFSVARALPRIDTVIASRGQAAARTIRIGTPRTGWKLA
jgi:hypothetical protein